VPESDLESASHEGWIALPQKESLTQLLIRGTARD
jgi:hypothetical protein